MQDHLLPYILDPRHAPDTLFLVAEEDFRVYAEDAAVSPATIAATAALHGAAAPSMQACHCAAAADAALPQLSQTLLRRCWRCAAPLTRLTQTLRCAIETQSAAAPQLLSLL
jgi:hypothetical protein